MAANKWEVVLDPDAFIPDATNHPDRGVIQNRSYLAFDDTTPETCYSKAFRLPDAYAGGTVTVAIAFAAATETNTSNKVEFEVDVEALSSADAIDTDAASSFSTSLTLVNPTCLATAGYLKIATASIASMDSAAAGDYIRISLARDADDGTNDTATGDARVFWVALYEA